MLNEKAQETEYSWPRVMSDRKAALARVTCEIWISCPSRHPQGGFEPPAHWISVES